MANEVQISSLAVDPLSSFKFCNNSVTFPGEDPWKRVCSMLRRRNDRSCEIYNMCRLIWFFSQWTLRFLSSLCIRDTLHTFESRELEILLSYCYIFKAKWIYSVCLTYMYHYCTCIISINRLFHGSLDNWIIFVDFRVSLLRWRRLCSIYRNCAFCVIRSRSSLRDSRLYGWVLLLHISCVTVVALLRDILYRTYYTDFYLTAWR